MKETKRKNSPLANLKIFLGILVLLFVIFIAVNAFIFKAVIDHYSKGSNYPEARAYMASALEINVLYIYPISKRFWWDCALTKPFYLIRDKLFDIGYSKFPKDEIEKEYWWRAIKYNEYRELVEDKEGVWGRNPSPGKYLNSKANKFIAWDKELYSHIEPFAEAKITDKTDKTVAEQKLVDFVEVVHIYIIENHTLNDKLENDRQVKAGIRKNVGLYISDTQVREFDKLYKKYLALLEYSKKYEKESYDYYFSKPDFWLNGEMFVYNDSLDILQSKFYSNKLQCNDPYLKINVDAHKKIREYYFAHKDELTPALRFDAGSIALTINPLIAYKCRQNPAMQDYIQYVLYRYENYDNLLRKLPKKRTTTLEAIKNGILQEYKNTDKDRLEQLKSIGIK